MRRASAAGARQLRRIRSLPPDGVAVDGRSRPSVRRRVGMDGERVRAVPRLSPACGSPRRIQRKVHVQSAGPARRFLRHAGIPRAVHVPQLLLPRRSLAGFGHSPRENRMSLDPALLDYEPDSASFLEAVLRGLSQPQKTLPTSFLYDERGSRLFDEICELPEYYPTRTERSIMRTYAAEIARLIGPRVALVEYGSGSGVKTRELLETLIDPVAYVPVDISRTHL